MKNDNITICQTLESSKKITLKEESNHVILAVAQQLNHFSWQKVFVLLQETVGLIDDTPGCKKIVHEGA